MPPSRASRARRTRNCRSFAACASTAYVGLESGHAETLALLGKNYTPEKAERELLREDFLAARPKRGMEGRYVS